MKAFNRREYDRLYYQRNRAKRRAQVDAWRQNNLDKVRAASKRWYNQLPRIVDKLRRQLNIPIDEARRLAEKITQERQQ